MSSLAPMLDELSCQAHKYLMIADRRVWSAILRLVAACEESPDAQLRNGHALALLLATLPPAPARSGGYPRIWYGYRSSFCVGAGVGVAVGWLSRGADRRRLTLLPDEGTWACWAEAPRRVDEVAKLPHSDPSLVRVTRLGPRGVAWVHLVRALPPSAFHEDLVRFLLCHTALQANAKPQIEVGRT